MVSDINTPRPPDEARRDGERVRDAAARESASVREEAGRAGESLKDGASRFASSAREKAYEQAESGKDFAASNLDDFTAAIRKASDELGERDQSMAANLVREAASGLEQVSGAIQGKSVQELTRSVAGFARRQPAAFLIGAALAGVALGRFARASSDHDQNEARGGYRDHGDADRRFSGGERSSGSSRTEASGSRHDRFSGTPGASSVEAGTRSAASSAGLAGVTSTPGSAGAGTTPTPDIPAGTSGGSTHVR